MTSSAELQITGSAKIKTFLQAFAVGFAVFPLTLDQGIVWPAQVLLWASVVMAVVSAVQYVLESHSAAASTPPLDLACHAPKSCRGLAGPA